MAVVRDPEKDVIKGGALRLTWISGAIGSVGVLVTAFNNNVTKLFGEDVSDGVKASVLIAIIAAWALIAVADLFARAIATSAHLRQVPDPEFAAPEGMRVKLTDGTDSKGWLVAAMRKPGDSANGSVEFLVLKDGEEPKWIEQKGLTLEGG